MDILNIFYTNSLWRLGLALVAGLFFWLFVVRYDPGQSRVDKRRGNRRNK